MYSKMRTMLLNPRTRRNDTSMIIILCDTYNYDHLAVTSLVAHTNPRATERLCYDLFYYYFISVCVLPSLLFGFFVFHFNGGRRATVGRARSATTLFGGRRRPTTGQTFTRLRVAKCGGNIVKRSDSDTNNSS